MHTAGRSNGAEGGHESKGKAKASGYGRAGPSSSPDTQRRGTHEKASRECRQKPRDQCRKEMGKRRCDKVQQTSPRASDRGNSSLHPDREILPRRRQVDRQDQRDRSQRRRLFPETASLGHHQRRVVEATIGKPEFGAQDPQVSRRLQLRGSRRETGSRPGDEVDEARRGRRGMGVQLRKGCSPSGGGRVAQTERSSRGHLPWANGGRKDREKGKEERGKGEERVKEKEEEGKRKERRKEREEEEQHLVRGEHERRRLKATPVVTKEGDCTLLRNRGRSKRKGTAKSRQESEEDDQEEGNRQLKLRGVREQLTRQHDSWFGRGVHLYPDEPNPPSRRRVSRGTSLPDADNHEDVPTARHRVRRPSWSPPRGHAPLFSSGLAEESHRTSSAGAYDFGHGHRHVGQGSAGQELGCPVPEVQEHRSHPQRQPLHDISASGGRPLGYPEPHPVARAFGCKARCLPRGQGQASGSHAGRQKRWRTGRLQRRLWRKTWRKEREGRQERKGKQRRWQEERRGSKELAGLEEERREEKASGVVSPEELVSTGVGSPGELQRSGVASPVEECKEGKLLIEDKPYDRGMELAPEAERRPELSLLDDAGSTLDLKSYPQKPHEADFSSSAHQDDFPTSGKATATLDWMPQPAPLISADKTLGSAKKDFALASLVGKTIGGCGSTLRQRLLEVLPLRSQSMGRDKTAIFPLPTSVNVYVALRPQLTSDECDWVCCVCLALNSYWGDHLFCDETPRDGKLSCLLQLIDEVQRLCGIQTPLESFSWDDFFTVRSIDYKGDEVKTARWFTWENISPALPGDVGSVPLAEVCTQGSRHYVENFDLYLKPPSERKFSKNPRVMVDDDSWARVCQGLVKSGVCTFIEEEDVFDPGTGPLLNGMFGVTKEDWTSDGTEIFRLIMNLIPLNDLCVPMAGDVQTLPAWGGMSPFFLQPGENLLVTSEDVKCFFYTMSVPDCWTKYLAFNKLVPQGVLPCELKDKRVYIASRVLPMGFLNSVSLAQHVHRNLVLWSTGEGSAKRPNAPEDEHRKDLPFTVGNPSWRVYLDNYDLLEKVRSTSMVDLEGTAAPGVLALRQEYGVWSVPRNEKKAVARSHHCEVQGATVDGIAGVAYPKESKLNKYFSLAFSLSLAPKASQKQWQIACGGLVYFTMFRRPLLGSLNKVWQHIESFNTAGAQQRESPPECIMELVRFLGLLPLARIDFRLDVHPLVTCSDASSQGGGVCVSAGVSPYGAHVSQGTLRGQVAEVNTTDSIVTIGLFDGIGALRVAAEALGVRILGHISVEKHEPAQRVVESHYPGTVVVNDVTEVDEDMVHKWSTMFSQCTLVILGGGPPCQGVSGLNYDRKGALRDERSCLFVHVDRIRSLVMKKFCWCPVHSLMESVQSMDANDREVMSKSFGGDPIACDAGSFTWCHRPRLYWLSWELVPMEGMDLHDGGTGKPRQLVLHAQQDLSEVIRSGWLKVDPAVAFPTFTTSRPRDHPGRKPAGILQCTPRELDQWIADRHRFPPYQYREGHCLVNKHNEFRLPDVQERELMLGFPLEYTAPCANKAGRGRQDYRDTRLTLLGNTWSVPVVAWLLGQLLFQLGFIPIMTPQDILDALMPGACPSAQGRLVRLPLNPQRGQVADRSYDLAFKLCNLVSIKGEDILLTTPTSQMQKFHRLRSSVPGKLWRWRVVSGWKWSLGQEHINALELRAILTSLKWRLQHQHHFSTRLLHLTDSQVCLHALTRGRSSSRKLRRTMARINSLVLAGNVQPIWGYIDTHQNPADKPSRWGRRVRTKFRNAT